MNFSTKIFFSHYILYFINDEYKICHSLNETHCSKSILNLYSNYFAKIHGDCYQFINESNFCFVRLLNNNNQRIIEKSWMKSYINKTRNEILPYRTCSKKFSGKKKPIIQYVKEIQIKMHHKLFDKIHNNPNFDEKDYSSHEIFSILHSYGFLLFDNRVTILRNLLYLFTNGKSNYNDIHREFINYVSSKKIESIYLEKFIAMKLHNNVEDVQLEMKEFISKNHGSLQNDKFCQELLEWKTKIIGFFELIKQTFCFHILTKNNDLIMKICHNINSKLIFDVPIETIDNIMFLLSNNCTISYISFTDRDNSFYIEFLNKKPFCNIDITEFYIKLYGLEEKELINENLQLRNFIEFLHERTQKSVILNIDKVHIVIQYNVDMNTFELCKENPDDMFDPDRLLLVSERILIPKIYHEIDVLCRIAHIIIGDFVNQDNIKLNHSLQFSTREKYNAIPDKNYLCLNISSNKLRIPYIHTKSTRDGKHEILFNGLGQIDTQLIGLEKLDQKYTNFNFLSGIIDDGFSLFEWNSTNDYMKCERIRNFISNMSDLFLANDLKISKMIDSDSLIIHDGDNKYMIFHIDHFIQNDLQTAFSFFACQNNIKLNPDQFQIKNVNRSKISSKENHEYTLKIYHDIASFRTDTQSKFQNFDRLQLPIKSPSQDIYRFEIKNSNFYLIISRIFLVKSQSENSSTI